MVEVAVVAQTVLDVAVLVSAQFLTTHTENGHTAEVAHV